MHMQVFMYLWAVWSPHLIPPPFWKSPPPSALFWMYLTEIFFNSRSSSSCCRLVSCLSTPSRCSWAFSEPSVQSKQKIKFSKFISEHVPCMWLSKCLHVYACFWVSWFCKEFHFNFSFRLCCYSVAKVMFGSLQPHGPAAHQAPLSFTIS